MVQRWLLTAVLALTGLLLFYQKTVISIAIVDILKVKGSNGQHILTQDEEGYVLAIGWIGFSLAPLFIGCLLDSLGARKILLTVLTLSGILTVFTPFFVKMGFYWTLGNRFIFGFLPGAWANTVFYLASRWIPLKEKGRYQATICVGYVLGDTLSLTLGGFICEKWGWEMAFYIPGIVCTIFTLIAYFFIFDSPQKHPRIGQNELDYLTSSIVKDKGNSGPTPYFKIMTNPAVLSVSLANSAANLNYAIPSILGAVYLNEVYHLNIEKDGLLLGGMMGITALSSPLIGYLADIAIKKGVTVIYLRKISNNLSTIIPAICCAIFATYETPVFYCLLLLFMTSIFYGGSVAGHQANYSDLSYNHIAFVSSYSLFLANIPAVLQPMMISLLSLHFDKKTTWRVIFGATGAVNVLATVIYTIFARGNRQSFDRIEEELPKDKHNISKSADPA